MPERTWHRRAVTALRVTVARDEARADGDVARARANEYEQPPQVGHTMLAVGIDATAEPIAALDRVGVARGDGRRKAAILAERDDLRPGSARDVSGAVRRPVVDHDYAHVAELCTQLGEDRRE